MCDNDKCTIQWFHSLVKEVEKRLKNVPLVLTYTKDINYDYISLLFNNQTIHTGIKL